jgi:hypothetical protein
MEFEKRMYFLVPYNISPIQQAIQAGHAALEYARKYGDDEDFIDFADNHKTWIILNGGTTNNGFKIGTGKAKGMLNQVVQDILEFNSENPKYEIKFATFQEPDLNDALTAICLIVDERVFNREDYPDFNDWIKKNQHEVEYFNWGVEKQIDVYIKDVDIDYKIYFLKQLLNTKKLA